MVEPIQSHHLDACYLYSPVPSPFSLFDCAGGSRRKGIHFKRIPPGLKDLGLLNLDHLKPPQVGDLTKPWSATIEILPFYYQRQSALTQGTLREIVGEE
ncbi:hypothetical protein FRB93_002476 [Tulasnella sp. JGI-2019a]|nr:hypothetical protein FRB93_002476 [Tulasnella sp. JGI-2019a]